MEICCEKSWSGRLRGQRHYHRSGQHSFRRRLGGAHRQHREHELADVCLPTATVHRRALRHREQRSFEQR
eukprot:556059-Pyramimonas_sp.AAC.1